MGYTHYWKVKEDIDERFFRMIQAKAAEIASKSKAPVTISINTHPLHLKLVIEGMFSDSHETFYLTPKKNTFNFCKTAHKPYDEVVVGVLNYAGHLNQFNWWSDGDNADLTKGVELSDTPLSILLPPLEYEDMVI